MFCFGFKNSGQNLPRTGLLFYSRLPNSGDVVWDENATFDENMYDGGWILPVECYAAVGVAFWFSDATTPVARTGVEILAWENINTTVNGIEVSFSLADGLLVKWHRIAYIPNAYPFVDKDGGSTRPFQGLQYLAIPVGGLDFTHASILGTFTVTYPGACGGNRITVAAGKITITAGDIWGRITIYNGATAWGVYEVASALSATSGVFWDVSGNGRHLLFTVADTAAVCLSGREKGSNYLDENGSVDIGSKIEDFIFSLQDDSVFSYQDNITMFA